MNNKNILISGAGIAGLTLAYWLKKFGFHPTVIETAPELRKGGYMIDFWGVGFDVAERMGLLKALGQKHYHIDEIRFVDENNKRKGGMNVDKLRKLINYRHYNLLRAGLAEVIYNEVKDDVEVLFGRTIKSLKQTEKDVHVEFSDGSTNSYNLVVGADGLHSNTRGLAFDKPDKEYISYLGYYTASFTVDNHLGNDHTFLSYSTPGKQVSIYSIEEGKLATFFIWKSDELQYDYHDTAAMQQILVNVFKNEGWECPAILKNMYTAPDFYFDSVSQVKMERWSKNRVTLVGDACQCVSLIAGQGSALAMAGAFILARELNKTNGDYVTAFSHYEQYLKPEIIRKQKMAADFASSFVPDSKFGIWVRDKFTNLMFLPFVSKYFINRFISDNLDLRKY